MIRSLTRRADEPVFPVIVAAAAFAATLSVTVPFGPLLALAVLIVPGRWKSITFWSSLGAALGGGLLIRSRAWLDATRWLSNYGVATLLVIAATRCP